MRESKVLNKFSSHKYSINTGRRTSLIPIGNADDENYDPYMERDVKHPTTVLETFLHLVKGSFGTGVLAMAAAFVHSGYVVGCIGTILSVIVCTHCVHMLLRCEYELCKRKKIPSMTYTTVAEVALAEGPQKYRRFAPKAHFVISSFMIINQVGSCCVYVVFISQNIKLIADFYLADPVNLKTVMLIILLPLILINWIRDLKFLAPFSILGNMATLVSFGIIFYYIFREPIDFKAAHATGTLMGFPLFIGTVLFALEAIGMILPLTKEMKNPRKFKAPCGVLNLAMVIIGTVFVSVGLFGYLNYGEASKGSITLNLPNNEPLAQAVMGMLAFAIFISHGLNLYVAIDIIWNEYVGKRFHEGRMKTVGEYVTRTLIVLVTFLLAIAIPNLGLFISLIGALCLSTLGLAFPALIETCIFWNHTSGIAKKWMMIKNIIIVIIAILGLVIGVSTSCYEIVDKVFLGN